MCIHLLLISGKPFSLGCFGDLTLKLVPLLFRVTGRLGVVSKTYFKWFNLGITFH